jgi:hypothetical protein
MRIDLKKKKRVTGMSVGRAGRTLIEMCSDFTEKPIRRNKKTNVEKQRYDALVSDMKRKAHDQQRIDDVKTIKDRPGIRHEKNIVWEFIKKEKRENKTSDWIIKNWLKPRNEPDRKTVGEEYRRTELDAVIKEWIDSQSKIKKWYTYEDVEEKSERLLRSQRIYVDYKEKWLTIWKENRKGASSDGERKKNIAEIRKRERRTKRRELSKNKDIRKKRRKQGEKENKERREKDRRQERVSKKREKYKWLEGWEDERIRKSNIKSKEIKEGRLKRKKELSSTRKWKEKKEKKRKKWYDIKKKKIDEVVEVEDFRREERVFWKTQQEKELARKREKCKTRSEYKKEEEKYEREREKKEGMRRWTIRDVRRYRYDDEVRDVRDRRGRREYSEERYRHEKERVRKKEAERDSERELEKRKEREEEVGNDLDKAK